MRIWLRGLLIPYFRPESNQVRDYRLRRDHPDLEYDFTGNHKVRQKYLSPPRRSNMLYLPPGVNQSLLREPALPIVIAEGEFKTLTLWRAANRGAPSRPLDFFQWGCLASTTGAEPWANGCAGWQSHRRKGSYPGSRLAGVGWP
jgi:hypothetical protein